MLLINHAEKTKCCQTKNLNKIQRIDVNSFCLSSEFLGGGTESSTDVTDDPTINQ